MLEDDVADGDGGEQDDAPVPDGGVLVLAATPIGNVGDASDRLRTLLATADVVAAEDTRRLRALAARLGVEVRGRVVSHHEHNEAARSDELLAAVAAGATVVVVSDAGMPAVSDPGFRVVGAAAQAGLRVTAAPGPSAVLTALALSGLPTDRFCFEGFAPRKAGERARALADLADERRTLVFFESPHRLADLLAAMAEAFGADRPAAVCRELTKRYEEVRRGPLVELAQWAADGHVRGEIVVVVGGAARPAVPDLATLVAQVRARVDAGERHKEVVAEVAAATGTPRRPLYEATLRPRP
ncbi:16S rRNA (cytidine(1402)-2'-O)-methyltransferase [Cellulomonas composti]|uniref:16S rRNA (cytidine(1402)-2'-O)-methyltransferase n=1 Tax=Cellulomonas composti TaxID=266130 RepID=UPI0011BF6BC1